MKGTPTIGKAKSLKEKRELAAELGKSPTSLNYLPNVLSIYFPGPVVLAPHTCRLLTMVHE
jgi:hypothetical protein